MSGPRALVFVGISLGLLGCERAPTATPDASGQDTEAIAPVETLTLRRHAVLSTSFPIHAGPEAEAPSVTLMAFERAVEILDEREGWWQIRTLSPVEAAALGLDASAGLGILELSGWTPAQPDCEVQLEPAAAVEPGAPSDEPTTKAAQFDFVIPASVPLLWPDGSQAGVARETHGFHRPAMAWPAHVGTRKLLCHDERVSVSLGRVAGLLCVDFADLVASSADARAGVDFIALDTGPPTPESGSGGLKGALDRDHIREVVRGNIEDVRACYNAGLAADPSLEGRVAIEFVIGSDGRVSAAAVKEDSFPDAQVGSCIADMALGWQFDEPLGEGNVVVLYPFNLSPG